MVLGLSRMASTALGLSGAWFLGFLGLVAYHEKAELSAAYHRGAVGEAVHYFGASHHKNKHRGEFHEVPGHRKLAAVDPEQNAAAMSAYWARIGASGGGASADSYEAHCAPATSGKKLVVSTPARNGGCGLEKAIACQPTIRVDRIGDAGADCAGDADCRVVVVLRDPRDRLASALALMYKGSASRSDDAPAGMDNAAGVRNKRCSKFVDAVAKTLGDREKFAEACRAPGTPVPDFDPRSPPTDPLFARQVDRDSAGAEFLCFDDLDAGFSKTVAPYCAVDASPDRRCVLESVVSKSFSQSMPGEAQRAVGRVWCSRARRHPAQFDDGARAAIDAYVRDVYSEDVALYEKHCGKHAIAAGRDAVGAVDRDYGMPDPKGGPGQPPVVSDHPLPAHLHKATKRREDPDTHGQLRAKQKARKKREHTLWDIVTLGIMRRL